VSLIALLAGIAGAAGTVMYFERTDNSVTPASERALPSASSTVAKPKKGETIANVVYKAAGPAVVSIRTQTGSGTGFLVDKQGTVVTNDHVIEEAAGSTVQVRFGTEGDVLRGRIRGADPSTDLAVVVISASDIPKGVTPLKFADSDDVRVGDQVMAIGTPFGYDHTLTTGVVSSLNRQIQAPNRYQIDGVLQTDAAINPGNSGGPLLDAAGNVVGVNSQIATSSQYSQGNVGIGFAVPSNAARIVVPQLRDGKTVEHAWLGVVTQPPEGGSTGVQIASLSPGGPAATGGLRVHDVVTAIDGQKVKSPTDLPAIINGRQPRTAVTLSVVRNDKRTSVKITLGVRPKNP